ncbi:hypothetical protein [Prevotella sp.]|uniref:hypothetical protein n=1 Tax=Prevotella sp. TaxID=59823 RepID=UPI003AB23C70
MKQVEERCISLLFEEAEIAKFSPKEVREHEASKMAYRDIKNSIDTAKQEGKEEGIAIGKEEGIAIGKEEGKNEMNLEIAKDMLAMNIDEATVIKLTGLTLEQLQQLK